MLEHLSIKNFALIDSLDVNFSNELSIITGETGAGKSILLGALGLIAGNRADKNSLNNKEKKCIVEASFNIETLQLSTFFDHHNLDFEKQTIIRREISSTGKSRAFINDTPVSLGQLKELSAQLIHIHSQHQTLRLNNKHYQLSVVDIYAQHQTELVYYKNDYKQLSTLKNKLRELQLKEAEGKKELDYLQFQYDELEEANLQENEQEELENEHKTLSNIEEIKDVLSNVVMGLSSGEETALSTLNTIKTLLASIVQFNTNIENLNERLNSVLIELQDISNELENIEGNVQVNPERLLEISDRLDLIYSLQQKHQTNSITELLEVKTNLNAQIQQVGSLEEEISNCKKDLEKIEAAVFSKADKLSKHRKKAIPSIEKHVNKLLATLAMPHAKLKIDQVPLPEHNEFGKDDISFLLQANKGSDFQLLSKVASGGELSRLMLSIQSLIAQRSALPTILFDEIDTGVSGEVANKVGEIMSEMSKKLQVITITHLPQIASKGEEHFLVYKEENKKNTLSNIKTLSAKERIVEIAKMLSTNNPSTAALKNAEELLSN